MIDPESLDTLSQEMRARMLEDRALLDKLRDEIRPLRTSTRRIQPRSATAISLVGTDGGNNRIEFDPFMAQLVRVVDSANNEYCLEVVTPSSNVDALSARQFNQDGTPRTPLGEMMRYLDAPLSTCISWVCRGDVLWRGGGYLCSWAFGVSFWGLVWIL